MLRLPSFQFLLLCAALPAAAETRPFTASDLFQIKEVEDPHLSPDGQWVAYTVRTDSLAKDKSDRDVWMAPLAGGPAMRVTSSEKSETDPRFSPDGRYLAFLSSREGEHAQVFLIDRRGGEAQRLTDFKADVSALTWSPDSKRLALIVSDVDPNEPKEGVKKDDETTEKPIVIHRLKFKSDGEGYLSDVRSHLYVFDVAAKTSVQVTSGGFDDDAPTWSPDGKRLAFTSNRTADADANENTDVFVVDAAAGATPRAVTTSKATDAQPEWSPDGQWLTFVEGGLDAEDTIYTANHVSIVPAAGGAVRALTAGLDRNVSRPRFSADGKQVFFVLEDHGSQHLARVSVAAGTIDRPVSGERTVYDYDLGPKGEIVVLESTPRVPSEISLVTPTGLKRLTTTNDAFLQDIQLANVQKVVATSPDGTKVDFFLALPADYKPGTRLPLLLRPHGGPAEQDSAAFEFDWHYYAGHGYAVVMPNYRGSTGYGRAWSRAIWAAWGEKDLMDVIASVDQVIAMGIADPERLGVGGWSYGGYLTNYAITKTSRFKAAVAGASGFAMLSNYGTDDLQYWWETELGLPWKNVELWNRLSPMFDIEKVTAPTLVLCGASDMRVPLLNSEQLYQSLKRRGVETELVIYPGQYHSIRTPSYRKDRLERSLAWYDRLLKGASAAPSSAGR